MATFSQLRVQDIITLSPNMRRLRLSGTALRDFPDTAPGAYIKLLFNPDGSPVVNPVEGQSKLMRTYTVRHFDPNQHTLDIDVVLHGHSEPSGPASHWAQTAQRGSQISFAGPGSIKALPADYDWVLFAGDMTALPAIESHLQQLPDNTQGYGIIKVQTPEDIRPLQHPKNLELIWLSDKNTSLAARMQQLTLPQGKPAIWAASEFSDMRAMRKVLQQEWQIDRRRIYLSSYWKQGRSEDQHKLDKRQDQQQQAEQAEAGSK